MVFTGPAWLPSAAAAGDQLGQLERALEAWTTPAEEVLSRFVGRSVSASSFHIRGIHHVAAYCGDYRSEAELFAWLDGLRQDARLSDLTWGPSYIAPRHYGTPGTWVSCRLAGRPVELFSCRHSGPWSDFPLHRRQALMSHVALAVDGAHHVEPVLRYLAHYPELDLLCFTAGDSLDHVYGHLVRTAPEAVLELVAQEAAAHGVGDG